MARLFTVQLDGQTRRQYGDSCPHYIPWQVIEPHQRQAEMNHHQTLEQLNGQGGLTPEALYAVLQDRPFEPIAISTAIEFLRTVAG